MSEFLLEIGSEEIPALMIQPALSQLKEGLLELFEDNGVGIDALILNQYSSPRRMTVAVSGLPEAQPERQEIILGPPKAVAMDDVGKPTRATFGFAKKNNVHPDDLEIFNTTKGSYVGCRVKHAERPFSEVLQEGLDAVIAGISWPKSMYWRRSRFRFIRPIRWLVAIWDGEILEYELEGIKAGRETRGHRFLGQSVLPIECLQEYKSVLRDHFVLVDEEERREKIRREIEAETPAGLEVIEDEALLGMTCYLNEFPTVLQGRFNEKFLDLPGEILVTVMRHHQKYFATQDSSGKIQNFFLTVLNTDDRFLDDIRCGHERVLKARLEDAAFFWENDRKQKLEGRVAELARVTFQKKLGSYSEKTERIRAICNQISGEATLDQAARLCKADLTTETVFEISELQGVMGGLCARSEGYPAEVWKAIYEHYFPITVDNVVPSTLNGAILSIADRIDTIAGCFSIGIRPTSSSDPFALRRQAQGIIKILLEKKLDLSIETLIEMGFKQFEIRADTTVDEVKDFLIRRIRYMLANDRGIDYDVINAVLGIKIITVSDLVRRAEALQNIRQENDFSSLAEADKRIRNILEGRDLDQSTSVDPSLFETQAEKELWDYFSILAPEIEGLLDQSEYEKSLSLMARLSGRLDQFFVDAMVLIDNDNLRNNRLAILVKLARMFRRVADISRVVRFKD
jgi:glycyl-tRNA synthetase beta chain